MLTTANEIQSACRAGLVLWGQREDKQLEWIGTSKQFKKCNKLMDNVDMAEAIEKL